VWEKSLLPYLLEDKKRYAGGYWTKPDEMDRIDCKGIETQRRDWTGICTDVITACLHELMINTNPQAAVAVVHKACADLLLGRVDISKLILTKGKPKTEPKAMFSVSYRCLFFLFLCVFLRHFQNASLNCKRSQRRRLQFEFFFFLLMCVFFLIFSSLTPRCRSSLTHVFENRLHQNPRGV
jgi:hypothetical protein